MPLWLSIALPFVAVVLTVAMNAVVNMKIKFASSLDEAKRDLKLFALRVTLGIYDLISIGVLIYNLFLNVNSNEPLTRGAVLDIAALVAALMFMVIMFFLDIIIFFLKRLTNSIFILNKITKLQKQRLELCLEQTSSSLPGSDKS